MDKHTYYGYSTGKFTFSRVNCRIHGYAHHGSMEVEIIDREYTISICGHVAGVIIPLTSWTTKNVDIVHDLSEEHQIAISKIQKVDPAATRRHCVCGKCRGVVWCPLIMSTTV